MMRHGRINQAACDDRFAKWLEEIECYDFGGPKSEMSAAFDAGWEAALKAAAEVAYSVNNHDEHMQWVIPTGPNSDRCGWCACLETIAGLLDPDDYKGTATPGIHDNEKEEE